MGAPPETNRRHPWTPRTLEAVAIIAAQLGCDEDEALRRLRERAESLQYRVHNYAQLVIDGIVRFDA
jgi:AmiR/NasT family two-component response regulator